MMDFGDDPLAHFLEDWEPGESDFIDGAARARESGSGTEPSLQTALAGRQISGEVVGRVEQSAGNVLAHSPDGGGASDNKEFRRAA
jgi:hypothetical protein